MMFPHTLQAGASLCIFLAAAFIASNADSALTGCADFTGALAA
jgi:hypothetical protein